MRRILLFAILLYCCFLSLKAQVANYTFSQSTGSYAQITGTTSTATGDDGTQTNIPIGFTFDFGGTAYTTFSITTNGMIKLGGGSISSGWINSLGNNAALRPLIAPFWDDNNLSSGTIRYSVTGSSPDQVLTVNWHNFKVGGTGSTAGASVSTLLMLYETTNVIEMVYSSPFTTTNSVTASVGINDMTSFLSVTPAATSTVSSTTANNSINATVMANLAGQKLTFTPPAPPTCTGPTVTFTEVEDCTNGFTVDINVSSMGDAGTYDVQVGGSSVGTISGTGTTNVGPFTNNIPIDITLVHDSDSDCDVTESGLVNATTCPTSVDCGGGGVTDTYCYTNSTFEVIEFTASDGTSPLKITFNSGTVENTYDELIVYDSDGTTQLYNGYGSGGNITGLNFTASGSSISFGVQADGSNACGSGQTIINYTVTCLSCTPATAGNATLSPNCPTDNSVTFDVTNMGSASSLTVTNNAGGVNPSDITSTGTGYTITGLPTNGSSVTITLTPDDDPVCAITLGPITLTGCPPANDECADALELTVNPDLTCSNVTAGTTTLATGSGFPNCTGTANNDVWFYFEATATSHQVRILNVVNQGGGTSTSTDMGQELFSDCAGTSVDCSDPNDKLYTGLTIGATYYLRVYGWSSLIQNNNFNVCVGTPPAVPDCATLSTPTDTQTDVPLNTSLTWTAPATGGSPTGYKVYLGTTNPPSTLVSTVSAPTTSYTPTGQTYSTTYFWYVVPTNSTGDAVGCNSTIYSYTTAPPPPGVICSNPIVVGSLPYTTTDGTSAYGDDYNGSPGSSCSSTSSYLNGDDVVYSYTPTDDASINFDLTNIGSNYAGMFIYADCADIGSTCLDGDTNGSSTADLSVSDFMVTGGETYYIVISTWASPQSTTYTLNITENSCVNPSATYTVVEDCATSGGFLIDVNITSLGSATDVTVSDGSASQTTSTTGIVTMGPYINGTNITITVTNEQDGTCSISSGTLTQASCPPANNDCANATAIPVTLDGTCSNQILGTNVGATASGETPTPNCGSFGSGIDNWYSVTVPASGEVTIEMQSAGGPTDWVMQVYTGNCGSLVAVECDDDDGVGNFPLVNLTGRTPGEELLVRVFEWQNNATGSFNICAHSTPVCGANSVYLETANGTYTLDDPCEDGNGWTYYSAPGTPGDYMFAIEWDPNNTGANTTAKTNATVTINVQSMISATNGSISASYGMGRYWNVDLNGSSMNGLVNVKFFYDPLEKTAVETAASTFATTNGVPNNGFSWFKTQSAAFNPADITASDFQSSMVLLTEDGSGMENGVHYVQFNDISSFSGGTGATGAGAGFLPVELMVFRGNAMDAGNKLSWETASEQNAARFVIERSADGHSRWQDLGTVAATGNSQTTQQYSFMDDKPLVSAYYRLRMIDQDNTFAYSPIIQLQRHNKDAALTVFPVPAKEEVQVSFYLAQAGPVAIRVYDLTGKLVSQTTLNLASGLQQERLDVSSLTSGVYLLNLEADGQRYVERLIKQ